MENKKEALDGEAWIKKYYPVEAISLFNASDIECTQHSLNKWRGLTKEVLGQYGLVANGYAIEGYNFKFRVNDDSCALCIKYVVREKSCANCPLCKQLGKPCDVTEDSPYFTFTYKESPLPMIEALEKTLLSLQQNRKEDGK